MILHRKKIPVFLFFISFVLLVSVNVFGSLEFKDLKHNLEKSIWSDPSIPDFVLVFGKKKVFVRTPIPIGTFAHGDYSIKENNLILDNLFFVGNYEIGQIDKMVFKISKNSLGDINLTLQTESPLIFRKVKSFDGGKIIDKFNPHSAGFEMYEKLNLFFQQVGL